MFGKLSSLASIIGYLRDLGVGNYIVTELVQGQTRRWVIGWSYGDVHVSDVRFIFDLRYLFILDIYFSLGCCP